MEALLQDLKYALRQLRKSPGLTFTTVLILSIGIGVNTASFSIMDAVVMRPLSIPQLDRVVTLYEPEAKGDSQRVALADFADWQRQSHAFEELAARTPADLTMTGNGEAAHVRAEYTSPSFFRVLGAGAWLGRTFTTEETQTGRNNVAVLSYAFWKAHFGADPAALGRTIELDGHPATVIGILPRTMQYPAGTDFFLPLAPDPAELANRNSHNFIVNARLRKGVSLAQAQAEMTLIAGHLAAMYPATNQGRSARVETLLYEITGDLTPRYFRFMQGATFFVLVIVCANMANLQLARGLARRGEIAMRSALGATRSRLLRQLLTENLLLGLLGGAGGILFAYANLRVSEALMPERVARMLPGWANISLNGRTLAGSLCLAMAAGILAGLAPALAAMRVDLVEQLKSGARAVAGPARGHTLRHALAVAQIAFAVALVTGAALMSKGMLGMLHQGDAYDPSRKLTFEVNLPAARYDSPQELAAWYRQSLERLRAIPGVQQAAVTSALPVSDDGWMDEGEIEGRPNPPGNAPTALRIVASDTYFDAFHLRPVSGTDGGRLFASSDTVDSQPVAVISRDLGASWFPGQTPLGHRIRMGSGLDRTPWLTVVGVVDDANYFNWVRSRPAAVYMNAAQLPPARMLYSVTTQSDPGSFAPAVRAALARLDPAIPLDNVESYTRFLHEKLTGMFFVAGTLGFDACIALLLSAIGIFSVMSNQVAQRTREIGVRLAMGAQRGDVLRMILGRAGWLTGPGLCLGTLFAFLLARLLASLLYQVSPNDPLVFAATVAAIAATALLASWIPAHRAAAIDPVVALRDE
jgi:putative ABC transport system permease protein